MFAYHIRSVLAASDTASGVAELAVQSEMETATDVARIVTPGRTQFHPGVAKGWINFNGTGTPAINASHNVTSLTDNGVGDYTVVWNTDFSSANYAVAGAARYNTAGFFANACYVSIANVSSALATTGSRIWTSFQDGSAGDCECVTVIAFGDQ